MKGADNHIIHKLNLEVDASTKSVAHDFKNNISIYLKNELFPYLEELFQSYESTLGNDIIQVDQLHIDLSHSGTHSFESLKSALKEQLKQQLVAVIMHPEKYPDTVVKIDKNEHDVQTLIHFLETGLAPWWTTTKSANIFSIEQLKEYTTSSTYASLMLTAIGRSYVQQRLLHQFTDEQIQLILLPISPIKEVRGIIEAPISLLTQSGVVRRLYWNWVMQTLQQRITSVDAAVVWLHSKLNSIIADEKVLKAWTKWLNTLNVNVGEAAIRNQSSEFLEAQEQKESTANIISDASFEDADLSKYRSTENEVPENRQSQSDEKAPSIETSALAVNEIKEIAKSENEGQELKEGNENPKKGATNFDQNNTQSEESRLNTGANNLTSSKVERSDLEITSSKGDTPIEGIINVDKSAAIVASPENKNDVVANANTKEIKETLATDQSKFKGNEGIISEKPFGARDHQENHLKKGDQQIAQEQNENLKQEQNLSNHKRESTAEGVFDEAGTISSTIEIDNEEKSKGQFNHQQKVDKKEVAAFSDSITLENQNLRETPNPVKLRGSILDDDAIAAKFDAFYKQLSEPVTYPKSTQKVFYLENAGLLLLHPYLRSFFEQCGVYEGDEFTDIEQAIHLLHYLATGEEQQHESVLVFEKFLCNFPLEESIPKSLKITEEQKAQATELLEAVLEHWGVLKGASIDLLRGEFLQRQGKLVLKGKQPRIVIERKTHDILLDKLPWNIGLFKLPWRDTITFADW